MARQRHECRVSGCKNDAICLPKLIIPPHPLSVKQRGQSRIMGVPVCNRHMRDLKPREFLSDPSILRALEAGFREENVTPDFNHAYFLRVGVKTKEFEQWELLDAAAAIERANAG